MSEPADSAATISADANAALARFHPLIAAWFRDRYGTPTNVQASAWPVIANGEHVLLTAPTGSGKTLTAFLWALDALLTARYPAGGTRVLYVSPLKALNSDIRRNLEEPLAELRERFAAAELTTPALQARTRSGDTPSDERARLLRRPPEILVTTPESLNLMLTHRRGRAALAGIRVVITDEIHELAGSRRGVALCTALERIAIEHGEFQRIALSATVTPLPEIARWIGGRRLLGTLAAPRYEPRAVRIVVGNDRKDIGLRVVAPDAESRAVDVQDPVWRPLAERLRREIGPVRTALVFANSRRTAEHLALRLADSVLDAPSGAGPEESTQPSDGPQVYAHHGSLARELRGAIEGRLKRGELRAIVATSSLEMGIDIGSVERVLLVQSPPSVASTLQRIGRAGHAVGARSEGVLLPTHGRDFLLAATLVEAVRERAIEPLRPLEAPLDVLVQHVVSLCADTTWRLDELLAVLRCASPYATLDEATFASIVELLDGRFAALRRGSLAPRLAHDRSTGTARALRSAVLALYRSGGSIPDRGYYALRADDSGARIGELDEEFVWEAKVGQIFALGARHWRIRRITHEEVFVEPTRATPNTPPFWRSEPLDRPHAFALRAATLLGRFDELLAARHGERTLHTTLQDEFAFDAPAATALCEFLVAQRAHTRAALPNRESLLIEEIVSAPGGYHSATNERQLAFHTLWGGRVNRPFAMLLVTVAKEALGYRPEVHIGDDVVVLLLREPCAPARMVELVIAARGRLADIVRAELPLAPFFGARFRECAGRALLLGPRRFGERRPLWLTRRQAKELLDDVAAEPDFPILREAARSCLVDEFDLPALAARLAELADGRIAWHTTHTSVPSPFAADVAFDLISRHMYADDTPPRAAQLPELDALAFLAGDTTGPPQFRAQDVADYARRRAREEPGWLPLDALELAQWIRERGALTDTASRSLIAALRRDHGDAAQVVLAAASEDLVVLRCADGRHFLCARDRASDWAKTIDSAQLVAYTAQLADDHWRPGPFWTASAVASPLAPAALANELWAYLPPLPQAELQEALPWPIERAAEVVAAAIASGELLPCGIADDPRPHWGPPGALAALLRMRRRAARERVHAVPSTALPAFLARWQDSGDELANALATLSCVVAPVASWETELLPARVSEYSQHELDALLRTGAVQWRGCGDGRVALAIADDEDLLPIQTPRDDDAPAWLPHDSGHYDFHSLADRAALAPAVFSDLLWAAVWRGDLVADDFAPLREGCARDFRLPDVAAVTRAQASAAARRFGSPPSRGLGTAARGVVSATRGLVAARARGWPGLFRAASPSRGRGDDALIRHERAMRLARLLLARYGVVGRDLVVRERDGATWASVFRALRSLEWAGEVTAGEFVSGLSTPQFATAEAAALLAEVADADAPAGARDDDATRAFWLAATDPNSPCGLPGDWPLALPRRLPGNFLVFAADALVACVEGRGRRIRLVAADAALAHCVPLLRELLRQARQRGEAVTIEQIDEQPPTRHPQFAVLRATFAVHGDHRGHARLAELTGK